MSDQGKDLVDSTYWMTPQKIETGTMVCEWFGCLWAPLLAEYGQSRQLKDPLGYLTVLAHACFSVMFEYKTYLILLSCRIGSRYIWLSLF